MINETLINSDILGDEFVRQEAKMFTAINSVVELESRDYYPQILLDSHEQSGLPEQ